MIFNAVDHVSVSVGIIAVNCLQLLSQHREFRWSVCYRDEIERGGEYRATQKIAARYIENIYIFVGGWDWLIDEEIPTTEGKYLLFSKNIYLVKQIKISVSHES